MNRREALKERSEREFEKFRIFFSVGVVLTGGLAGLILKGTKGIDDWILILGGITDAILLLIAFRSFLRSEKYLKLLEKEVL